MIDGGERGKLERCKDYDFVKGKAKEYGII